MKQICADSILLTSKAGTLSFFPLFVLHVVSGKYHALQSTFQASIACYIACRATQ